MKLLAVETSGAAASIAVADGDSVTETALVGKGQRHAQTLATAARQLLEDLKIAPSDIDVVAVSVGPGSFTGLRVGVVFAKTFAWINSARLVAVNTLQGIAQRVPASQQIVTVISDAQREELFVGDFRRDAASGIVEPLGEIRIAPVDELTPAGVLTGPALERFAARIPAPFPRADARVWAPSAAAVACVAQFQAAAEKWDDPITLEPLYIRRSYAEEKRGPATAHHHS